MKLQKIYSGDWKETLYLGEHESGLGVFIIPKPGFIKKYAMFGTRYGSVDNTFIPLGKTEKIQVPDGIAHFLEHKMFEQPDGSNAFDLFSKYGANANAFTSFTSTCYLFSCTGHFDENLAHLLSYVQEPYFTDENVAKEQGIIGQEIRMYDDDPEWQVQFGLLKALYENNPVKLDIAGTIESISHIDKEVLYTCYNTFYNPANMVLCVAGDVDPEKIAALLDTHIQKGRPSGRVESFYPAEPARVHQTLREQRLEVSIPLFDIGFKDNAPETGEALLKNEIAAKLLLKILAGRSSELYASLYQEGLVNASFSTDLMMEPQFSCAIVGGESQQPLQVQQRLLQAIADIRENGPDRQAFAHAKKALYGNFLRCFNDVEDIAGMFTRNILNGVNIFRFKTLLDQVDEAFAMAWFNRVFTEENMAMSIVWPADRQS